MIRLAVLAAGLSAVAAPAADDPPAPVSRADALKGQNNLKQIGLALFNSADAMQRFPSDVTPAGEPKAWSWRVQILPYIEQEELFKKLDLKAGWDSPENKAVLEKAAMPKVFEVPGRPAKKGETYFRSFTSPKGTKAGRAWLVAGEKGPRLPADIADGTSNTFAVVEAGESVPWYAPDTLTYDPQKPLPQLGGKDAKTFLVLMADGSVRPVRRDADEKVLRALITRDGGEVVTLPK